METKQNPPVGLPTFNDPGRYGEQIITQGQFPDGSGMSSGGGGTEIQSFDFPTPDTTTGTPKPVNPAKKARQEGKTVRKNIRQNSRAKDIELNNFIKEQKLRQRKGEMLPVGLSSSGLATKTTLPSADVLTESPFDMMGQQYDQQSPQGTVPMQNLMPDQTAMSYQPPMPGNVQGSAQPVFNPSATNAAQQIYGSQEQRQQSVPGAPLYLKKENALKAGKEKIEGKPYGTTIRNDENYGGAPLRMHHDTGKLVTYDKFVSDQGKLHMGSESPYAGITHSQISKNTFPHKQSKQYIKDSIVGKINSGKPLTNFLDHKVIGNYRMGYGGKPPNPNDIRRIKQLKK